VTRSVLGIQDFSFSHVFPPPAQFLAIPRIIQRVQNSQKMVAKAGFLALESAKGKTLTGGHSNDKVKSDYFSCAICTIGIVL
jgi:hypothetical protein